MEQFTVRQVRGILGLSLSEMAKLMDMNPQTYRNKELGIRKWYIEEANKFASVSKIDPDKIIFNK